ncbi:MAG: hypothetical protein LBP59_16950 [Planctomycetaceae bacterium]|nr:hypothetical protein [Planctomycetaceae bacterium]
MLNTIDLPNENRRLHLEVLNSLMFLTQTLNRMRPKQYRILYAIRQSHRKF